MVRVAVDGMSVAVPPLEPEHRAWYRSNAIFYTGCSCLMPEAGTWAAMLEDQEHDVSGATELIDRSTSLLSGQDGLANDDIAPAAWPDIQLIPVGDADGEVRLRCPPDQNWPADASQPGKRLCRLAGPPPGWPRQSILGLLVLAGHYTVFDRSVHVGVLRIAQARWES